MVVLQMSILYLRKLMEIKFIAFIVERGFEGFTQGPEEHKMGIKGSSTVQLYFQDCKVPVENLLGEIGKGSCHRFQYPEYRKIEIVRCRIRRSEACYSRLLFSMQIPASNSKQPIANFGAIKNKIAEMAIQYLGR